MNVDLEAVEERIKRLECILFGQTGNVYNNEEQVNLAFDKSLKHLFI